MNKKYCIKYFKIYKQEQLGEGLALEAEKALCALLCSSTDKFIRIKFIEGCLDNLANHRYVSNNILKLFIMIIQNVN